MSFSLSNISRSILVISVGLLLNAHIAESSKFLEDAGKGPNLAEYMCSVCVQVLTSATDAANAPALSKAAVTEEMRAQAYLSAFDARCSFFGACDRMVMMRTVTAAGGNPRESCQKAQFCPIHERWQWEGPKKLEERVVSEGAAAAALDVRVSMAYGARGSNKIRVSAISNTSWTDPFFAYEEQFKYRWTDNFLHTAVVDVTPGQQNEFTITAGAEPVTLSVYVPGPEEGVRGVIIADPCFQSQWIICLHQNEFDTFNRMTSLLNAINAHSDVHYWMILG